MHPDDSTKIGFGTVKRVESVVLVKALKPGPAAEDSSIDVNDNELAATVMWVKGQMRNARSLQDFPQLIRQWRWGGLV